MSESVLIIEVSFMYNICNFNLNSTSIISFDSPHKGECCSQGRSSDLESRGLIVLSLFP